MVQPLEGNLAISNKTMQLSFETEIAFPEVHHKDIIAKVQEVGYSQKC